MQVTVDARQIESAAARLRKVGEDLDDEIRDASTKIAPRWQQLLSGGASTVAERRLFVNGANAVARTDGITLNVGRGSLSGGLNTAQHYGAVEFGVRRDKVTTYTRRGRKGGSHTVTRHTARQLKPFTSGGRVFIPATKKMTSIVAKAWIKAAEDAVEEAFGG